MAEISNLQLGHALQADFLSFQSGLTSSWDLAIEPEWAATESLYWEAALSQFAQLAANFTALEEWFATGFWPASTSPSAETGQAEGQPPKATSSNSKPLPNLATNRRVAPDPETTQMQHSATLPTSAVFPVRTLRPTPAPKLPDTYHSDPPFADSLLANSTEASPLSESLESSPEQKFAVDSANFSQPKTPPSEVVPPQLNSTPAQQPESFQLVPNVVKRVRPLHQAPQTTAADFNQPEINPTAQVDITPLTRSQSKPLVQNLAVFAAELTNAEAAHFKNGFLPESEKTPNPAISPATAPISSSLAVAQSSALADSAPLRLRSTGATTQASSDSSSSEPIGGFEAVAPGSYPSPVFLASTSSLIPAIAAGDGSAILGESVPATSFAEKRAAEAKEEAEKEKKEKKEKGAAESPKHPATNLAGEIVSSPLLLSSLVEALLKPPASNPDQLSGPASADYNPLVSADISKQSSLSGFGSLSDLVSQLRENFGQANSGLEAKNIEKLLPPLLEKISTLPEPGKIGDVPPESNLQMANMPAEVFDLDVILEALTKKIWHDYKRFYGN